MQNTLLKDFELNSAQHVYAQFFSEMITEWLCENRSSADATDNDTAGSTFEAVGRKDMHELMSHVLSNISAEFILSARDFAVNQATQSYLHRLRNDFWFWGSKGLHVRG